jgi:hypothetical protein
MGNKMKRAIKMDIRDGSRQLRKSVGGGREERELDNREEDKNSVGSI